MAKLVLISKDKSTYKMTVYLNEQFLCDLSPSSKKIFELKGDTYSIYIFSKHSQNNSESEIINLDNNVMIEVSQGFTKPKLNIKYLDKEEIKNFETEKSTKVEIKKELPNSNLNLNVPEKKKTSVLSIIGTCILSLIVLYFGINFMIDGSKKVMHSNNDTEDYSYVVDKQGLEEDGWYKISGKVTNNTNKDTEGLSIEFKCYDSDHNHLDTIFAYTENLASHDTWAYEISTYKNADKINNCEYFKIKPYIKIAELH